MTEEKSFRPGAMLVAAIAVLLALAPFCAQRAQAAMAAESAAANTAVSMATSKTAKPIITPSKVSLVVGKSKTLKVKKGAAYKVVSKTFKSSKPKVAKVDKKSGKVTAVKAGTVKVTAIVKAKPRKAAKAKTYRLVCKVTVVKPASVGGGGKGDSDSQGSSGGDSAGAGESTLNPGGKADSGDATAPELDDRDGEGRTSDKAGKVLVAYCSGTGNTKRIAETIANRLGADTFAITPAQPYSSADLSYTNSESRVYRERNDPNRNVELVQVKPDGFEGYDTVLLGYPIWWGGASWVVDGFVKGNDFTGKTVVPFCTSASSPIGSSASDLAEMAGTGTWLAGKRFSSGASVAGVEEWADGLGLK